MMSSSGAGGVHRSQEFLIHDSGLDFTFILMFRKAHVCVSCCRALFLPVGRGVETAIPGT